MRAAQKPILADLGQARLGSTIPNTLITASGGRRIDYGSANTADHHLLARRFAANVLPARLPMKRPRPRKSAPGGSKIEARGGQNGLLEGFRGWKDRALKPRPFLKRFWKPF